MKRFDSLGVLCWLALAAVGCSQPMQEDADVEEAVAVAALQQGQDGSDEDFADAAEDAPVLDRECHFVDIRKQLVASYDVDGDAELSAGERADLREDFGGPLRRVERRHAAREARRALLHHIYDSDDSGKLDAEERAALISDLDARCELRMQRLTGKYDANGDGTLDASEWTAVRDDLAARFAHARGAILAHFDTNDSGKLELSERAAAWSAVHDRIEARWDALRAEYDTDGDGELDADEKLALREALQAKVRGENTP